MARKNKNLTLSLIVLVFILLCHGNCAPLRSVKVLPSELTLESPSTFSEPGNCEKIFSDLLNNTWENAAVFDPATGDVVHFGGHPLGAYAQSGYAYLYNYKNKTMKLAPTQRSGPRQCLVVGTYIDSLGQAAFVHGNVTHGSMGTGGFKNGYTTIGLADNYGPFFYDSKNQNFEYSRTLGAGFDRRHHANVAYEKNSDVMASLGANDLILYNARTNKIIYKPLPAELMNRTGYGIAADPVERKFVIFGGSGPQRWLSVAGDKQTNYDLFVKNDTWVYDVAADSWTQVTTSIANPPKGSPTFDFVNFPMIYEPLTGNILLRVNPVNQYIGSTSDWPDAETWAFQLKTQQWKKVVLIGAPAFPGLMTYDSINHKILIIGGGKNPGANPRPNLSRDFYACSVPRNGPALDTTEPLIIQLQTASTGSVTLSWDAKPNQNYVVYRAEAKPITGSYQALGSVSAGSFIDTTAKAGIIYGYQISAGSEGKRSSPVYNQPMRLSGLWASVENAKLVSLRWNVSLDPEVVGYHVYRGRGLQVESGAGTKLTVAGPWTQGTFADSTVDLSDGVVRFYWVKAVNRAGIESGASPWAATMPEAPLGATIKQLDPTGPTVGQKSFRISWNYPADMKVKGFHIYHVNNHMNTLSVPEAEVDAWYASWLPLTQDPITAHEYTFTVDSQDPAPHHYFYIRAVNNLNQTGFFTDIFSATDRRFMPHVQN